MSEGAFHHRRRPSLYSMLARLTTQVTKLVKALQSSGPYHHASSSYKAPGTTSATTAATTAASTDGPATGKVKWYNVRDRYGFIVPSSGGQDIFVHETAIAAANPDHWCPSLAKGETVSFVLRRGRRGPWAADVTGPDGLCVLGSVHAQCPDRPAQTDFCSVQDDLPLPPYPEPDQHLPPPPVLVAEVAADHQSIPPMSPLAPPFIPTPSSTKAIPTVFANLMTGKLPRDAVVHKSDNSELILAHGNTNQSIVLEVVDRAKKGSEERAMRTHFWELGLVAGYTKEEAGSEIFDQGGFGTTQVFKTWGSRGAP